MVVKNVLLFFLIFQCVLLANQKVDIKNPLPEEVESVIQEKYPNSWLPGENNYPNKFYNYYIKKYGKSPNISIGDYNGDGLVEYVVFFINNNFNNTKAYGTHYKIAVIEYISDGYQITLDTTIHGSASIRQKEENGIVEETLVDTTGGHYIIKTESNYVKNKILGEFDVKYNSVKINLSVVGSGLIYYANGKFNYCHFKYSSP